MPQIETVVQLIVEADPDYHYTVAPFEVIYHEHGRTNEHRISFGSVDEMEAVAQAMLKVCEFSRQGK